MIDQNDPNEPTPEPDFFNDDDAEDGAPNNPADDPSPFGESEDADGGDDDVFAMPPEPAGILRGFTTAKRWANDDKKVIVSVQINEPPFQNSEKLEVWYNTANRKDLTRLIRFATALGVAVQQRGGNVSFPGGIEKALNERAGRFIVASWDKEDGSSDAQVAKWLPKEGASMAWDAHMAELAERKESYTDEQMAILKKCPGVVPDDF